MFQSTKNTAGEMRGGWAGGSLLCRYLLLLID